jgi:hypothetical protein
VSSHTLQIDHITSKKKAAHLVTSWFFKGHFNITVPIRMHLDIPNVVFLSPFPYLTSLARSIWASTLFYVPDLVTI